MTTRRTPCNEPGASSDMVRDDPAPRRTARMLTRHTTRLLAIIAAVPLVLGVATAANAQTPSCTDATAAVASARAELDEANTVRGALPNPEPTSDEEAAVEAAEEAELEARGALAARLALDTDNGVPDLLEFNPNVYPGDVAPTSVDQLTRAFLEAVAADPDLGGGGQASVADALAHYDAADAAAEALADAEAALAAAVAEAEARTTAIAEADARIVTAQGDLDAALAVQETACAPEPTPTPTGTATPTPAPSVTTAAPVPSSTSTVVPVQPASRSGTLPNTGADAGFLVPLALLLVVGGATAVGATKLYKGRATRTTL